MEEQLQLVIRRTSRTLATVRSGCQVLWSKLLIQCPVKYFCLMNVWSDAMLTTFSHVTAINPKNRRDNFHLQCQRQPTYLMIHRESSHASQSTKRQRAARSCGFNYQPVAIFAISNGKSPTTSGKVLTQESKTSRILERIWHWNTVFCLIRFSQLQFCMFLFSDFKCANMFLE